jgi:ureidoacrylate peracid hydrolase
LEVIYRGARLRSSSPNARADLSVEKIAFYMTRLEFVLRRCGIEPLYLAGIETNDGVASTVRDA